MSDNFVIELTDEMVDSMATEKVNFYDWGHRTFHKDENGVWFLHHILIKHLMERKSTIIFMDGVTPDKVVEWGE